MQKDKYSNFLEEKIKRKKEYDRNRYRNMTENKKTS